MWSSMLKIIIGSLKCFSQNIGNVKRLKNKKFLSLQKKKNKYNDKNKERKKNKTGKKNPGKLIDIVIKF